MQHRHNPQPPAPLFPQSYSGFDENSQFFQPEVNYDTRPVPSVPHYPHSQQQTPPSSGGVAQRKPPVHQPASTSAAGALFEDLGQHEFFQSAIGNPLVRIGFDTAAKWGGDASKKGFEGITKYLEATNLKYYFNINNSYVPNKLQVILCPILHKSWKRRIFRTQEGQEHYLPPKDDLNAPDLYIPLMAFITYILVAAFVLGTRNEFTPEILGKFATNGLVAVCLEVLILKFGFYLLNSVNCSIFDLVSYSGYIFVGLVFNHIVGLILGSYAYYCSMLVTGIFMAIFMVRTLRLLILPDQEVANSALPANRRNYFLLCVALLQIILCYSLGVYRSV